MPSDPPTSRVLKISHVPLHCATVRRRDPLRVYPTETSCNSARVRESCAGKGSRTDPFTPCSGSGLTSFKMNLECAQPDERTVAWKFGTVHREVRLGRTAFCSCAHGGAARAGSFIGSINVTRTDVSSPSTHSQLYSLPTHSEPSTPICPESPHSPLSQITFPLTRFSSSTMSLSRLMTRMRSRGCGRPRRSSASGSTHLAMIFLFSMHIDRLLISLKNHGVDEEVRGMFDTGAETMDLPFQEKMRFEQGDDGFSFGSALRSHLKYTDSLLIRHGVQIQSRWCHRHR